MSAGRAGLTWRLAWGLWALFFVVIAVLVAVQPYRRTVTPVYHDAVADFRAGRDLYDSDKRFHYLPQFAVAFAAFAAVPRPWAEVPWRFIGLGLYLSAAVALARRLRSAGNADPFPMITFLMIPAALSAARSGQTNLPLAAAFVHAALALGADRWARAATWLLLAIVLKPIAIVMLLLAGATRVRLAWRLALGLVVLGLLPYAFQDAGYVTRQYAGAVQSWTAWNATQEHRFCDLAGFFRTMGREPGPALMTGLRAAAALGTLALWWLASRRLGEPERTLHLLGLSVTYLMLFNPMNETNSYVLMAPAVAAFAVLHRSGPSAVAGALVVMALGLGVDSYGNPIHPWTNLWLKALLAAAFYAGLALRIVRAPPDT